MLKVRSGHTGRVTITLRTLTTAPLTLDVQDDCAAGFETMLFAGNDARADYPDTCASGGYGKSCNGVACDGDVRTGEVWKLE